MTTSFHAGFTRLIVLVLGAIGVAAGVFFFTDTGTYHLTGTLETKTTAIPDLHTVSFAGVGTLKFVSGNNTGVTIKTDETLLDKIALTTGDHSVSIQFEGADYVRSLKLNPEDVHITITLSDAQTIETSGAIAFQTGSQIEGDELSLTTKGKTEGELRVISNDLQLQTDGHTDLTLSGSAFTETNITSNGTGALHLRDLRSPKISLQNNGTQKIHIGSTQELSMTSNGVTTLTYETTPAAIFADGRGQYLMSSYETFLEKHSTSTAE